MSGGQAYLETEMANLPLARGSQVEGYQALIKQGNHALPAAGTINWRRAEYKAPGSNTREEWVDALNRANVAINRVKGEYMSLPNHLKPIVFPKLHEFVEDYGYQFGTTNTDGLLAASKSDMKQAMWEMAGPNITGNVSESDVTGAPNYTPRRFGPGGALGTLASLVTIYRALYGARTGDGEGNSIAFLNYGGHVTPQPAFNENTTWGVDKAAVASVVWLVHQEASLREQLIDDAENIDDGINVTGAALFEITLTDEDIDFISNEESYKQYFSTTFSKDAITFVPILQNFYLTGKYFSDIDTAFEGTKDAVVNILLTTIRNDDDFRTLPDLTRPAAEAAIAESTGQTPAMNSQARDFILKMLIKTPIDILKGLVELIDPHVSISKLIKTGTGFAFNELSQAMDVPAQQINPDLTGEDLLQFILCLVDTAQKAGDDALSNATLADDANFFPRISIDGVDFTGTVSGMLMIPPSPLGLLYLLLELLKNEATDALTNVDGAATAAADETECEDNQEEE